MADGGSVIFKFEGDNKGLEKSTNSATKTLASMGSTALKTAGVITATMGAAFTGVVTASVKARGEIEQQMGGTEAVFGEYAEQVQKMATESFDKMGTSANDYMATINKMGSLMKGSGIDTKKAMDLSSQAMQRAADVASVMGISMESAMESIAGAAKGNFTMMDNLGVAMNATTIEAYALEKGINKTYNTMSNSEKIQLAMEMFLEKSAYAAGNYAKENKTLAGSISTLKASWSNFLAGAGDLGQVVGAATNSVNIIIQTVSEAIPSIIENLTTYLPQLVETGTTLLNSILAGITQNLPALMQTAITIIETIGNWIIQNLPQILLTGMQITMSLIQGIAQMLPSLIPQAVNAVVTLVEGLLDNIDLLIDAGIQLIIGLAEGLIEAIPQLIDKIPVIIEKIINAITNNLPKLVEMGIVLIVKLAVGLIKAIPQLVSKIPEIIAALVNGLANGISSMAEMGLNLIKGLWQGIKDAGAWLWSKISGFFGGIVDKIKGFFGIHSPSTLFRNAIGKNMALGIGVGFSDEMSNVSNDMKKSMKDIIPDINNTIGDVFDLSPTLSNTTTSSSNVTVQVYNNMETDFMGNLINNIKTFSNGSKNDYNYGMT